MKRVHDTVIGVTTEVLSRETLHVLKLRSIRFTLATHEGRRMLVVDANRATRKLFSKLEPSVRTKTIAGESEFAEALTRGASAGAGGVARRSFMALKGKGSWLGVLLIGTVEALYNYSQGASILQVLDTFGMTALKGALSMVVGTALVGFGVAALAMAGFAVTLATGPLLVVGLIVGVLVGLALDWVIPEATLSGLLHDLGNGAERWLHEFEDGLTSFEHWASNNFSYLPHLGG